MKAGFFRIVIVACCFCLLNGCGGGGAVVAPAVTPPVTPPSGGQTTVCTQGVGSGSWQQVTLASSMTSGGATLQSIYAGADCYIYVSMAINGTWRAKVSDIRTSPTSAANWSRIDSGFPADPVLGGTAYSVGWTMDSSGNIYTGIGNVPAAGVCSYCVVGKWNGSTWSFSNAPTGVVGGLLALNFDALGNLYASDRYGDFYEAPSGSGLKFGSALITHAYAAFGFPSGYVFTSKIINNVMYWGGEGPYMSSPLDFSSGTAAYGSNGFSSNATVFVTDGTAASAPTYIVAGSRAETATGYSTARFNGSSWSTLTASGIPQYGAAVEGAIVNGMTMGELFGNFEAGGAGGGVMHSTDFGVTWKFYNAGLPLLEQTFARRITVSPFDDSVYITAAIASGGNATELWYHP